MFLYSTGVIRDYFSIVKNGAEALPTLTISSPDATATEAEPTTSSFLLTRTRSTAASLAVNYTIGGTATKGSDYQSLPQSVTIPSRSSTVTIIVTPIDDSIGEGNETVVATLAADAAYTICAPSSAIVTITDNYPTNQPPSVSSGPDQTIAFPAGTSLHVTVSDDCLPSPPCVVTITWSKMSGPGSVMFGAASSIDTTVSFTLSAPMSCDSQQTTGRFPPATI